MKKSLLSLTFLAFSLFVSAQQPTVCVTTNGGSGGQVCDPSLLGNVNPCANLQRH